MKPTRILIVEDKAIIAESLASILLKAGYEICARCVSGEEALRAVEEHEPDLILMDIQLAGKLDGIQTVEQINSKHSIPVIFLTDFHDEKTINRAKHTHPAAYLLKPYKEHDLLIAIEIAFFNAGSGKEAQPGKNEKPQEEDYLFNDRFFIRDKEVLRRVDIADIQWIKAARAYYEIQTAQRHYTLVGNLSLFHKKFTHPLLLQVHRSYIVNMDKVTAIKGNMLIIGDANGAEIPISDSFRDDVDKRFFKV